MTMTRLLVLIVFAWSYVQAQLVFMPIVSDAVYSEDPYECTCDFTYYEYDPICGNNGITYSNPSYLYCQQKCRNPNLRIFYEGPCNKDYQIRRNFTSYSANQSAGPKVNHKCVCTTTADYNPVCGTNGITYDNPSLLRCEKKCKNHRLSISYSGLCREEKYFSEPLPFLADAVKKCDCSYSNERDPVCGTDGYTYPNPTALSCVSACNNPSLKIVHYGKCREEQRPHNYGAMRCGCTSTLQVYHPVCADNGVTYDNPSMLFCAEECLGRRLQMVSEQPCRDYLDVDERKLG